MQDASEKQIQGYLVQFNSRGEAVSIRKRGSRIRFYVGGGLEAARDMKFQKIPTKRGEAGWLHRIWIDKDPASDRPLLVTFPKRSSTHRTQFYRLDDFVPIRPDRLLRERELIES